MFAKAIEREPSNSEARRYIAYALLAIHEAPAAIEQFENLERISPFSSDERAKYVEALRLGGKSQKAISVLRRHLLSHPDDVSVRCDLAKIFASLDKVAEFQEACMQGMKLAKTTEDWDIFHSLLTDTLKTAPDQANTNAKEKPGG